MIRKILSYFGFVKLDAKRGWEFKGKFLVDESDEDDDYVIGIGDSILIHHDCGQVFWPLRHGQRRLLFSFADSVAMTPLNHSCPALSELVGEDDEATDCGTDG